MKVLALPTPVAELLRGSDYRVLITGASGWLGQAAVELLAHAFGAAWSERVCCFGSSTRRLHLRHGIQVEQRPLEEMTRLPCQPSILLHFAYLTREKVAHMSVVDYVATNRAISQSVCASAGSVGADKVFLTSSGAVYAALADPSSPDPSLLYGRLKLEDEALFERFAEAQAGRRVRAARLFNLSGAYINKLNSYALASFIEQARRGATLDIRASQPVVRSYTSAENLLGAVFGELLSPSSEPFVRFDTAGDCEIEVQALAELVRDLVDPTVTIRRPPLGTGAVDRYVGEGSFYRQMMQRHGVTEHPLKQQVGDTADYLIDELSHRHAIN